MRDLKLCGGREANELWHAHRNGKQGLQAPPNRTFIVDGTEVAANWGSEV